MLHRVRTAILLLWGRININHLLASGTAPATGYGAAPRTAASNVVPGTSSAPSTASPVTSPSTTSAPTKSAGAKGWYHRMMTKLKSWNPFKKKPATSAETI